MARDLLQLQVRKRPPRLRFEGRVLFLVDDAELMRRQLAGEDLPLTPELRSLLRDQISTDEITPAYICYYFDQTLGEFPYLGLHAGGEFPVTRGTVRRGGFVCSVSGRRRGKGSSREQSPYAELMAGIQVVIAENIERIYNENCQNLGVLTSTDFGLIERIRRGEEIALAEFTADTDPITRAVIEHGGLFEYNVARLQGQVPVPAVQSQQAGGTRPMTIAEKIFASHWVLDAGQGRCGVPWVAPADSGFVRTDWRFSHEYVSPMAAIFFEHKLGEDARINDPATVLMFRDHLTYLHQVMPPERVQLGLLEVARQLKHKQEEFARRQGVIYYGERVGVHFGSEAICHSKMLESYAEPGQLIVGTDSHTPHSGAIGCIAFGIGTTAIFNAWITKDVRVRVPPSFKVVVKGRKPANVTAKDFMLEILRHPYIRDGQAIGQVIEYAGEAIAALSVDERATMTNMAAEVGAFTGIVAPDEKTIEYLMAERGMSREQAESLCAGLFSDPGAAYVEVIEFDAASLRPMVALPGDPGNGRYVDELGTEVAINVAYAGSCTAGKKEDMDMYAAVLAEAHAAGLRVPASVQLFIQCGSQEVRQYCEERGYLQLFREVGAEFIEPGCGACIAAGPGTSRSPDEVTISSQNRNFPGRSGPGRLYLASPYTVAASAIAGRIVEWQPGRLSERLDPAGV